jgi:hypothetical protein
VLIEFFFIDCIDAGAVFNTALLWRYPIKDAAIAKALLCPADRFSAKTGFYRQIFL